MNARPSGSVLVLGVSASRRPLRQASRAGLMMAHPVCMELCQEGPGSGAGRMVTREPDAAPQPQRAGLHVDSGSLAASETVLGKDRRQCRAAAAGW